MRKKNAFTIIELLVTMMIIGTLSSTLIPRIGDAREEAKQTMTKVDESRRLASEVDFDGYTFGSDSAGGGANNNSDGIRYVGDDISVCREGKCITMQDRNLGATNNDITNKDSYGYHYQWGNNHGFKSCLTENCNSFPGSETKTTNRIKCDRPPYERNEFTYNVGDWCMLIPQHRNLRGGGNDNSSNNRGLDLNNPVDRKGPCPNGYHVPSIGEWDKLISLWAGINGISLGNYGKGLHRYTGSSTKFFKDFKIPFAGDRYWYDASVYDINKEAVFWSSSHDESGSENTSYFVELAQNLIWDGQVGEQSNGFSVRCFKD